MNELHLILKTPLRGPYPKGYSSCIFSLGCFWGAELSFWRLPGVFTTAVGYIGGKLKNPSYEDICSNKTGHAEAVMVVYNPQKISFVDLTRHFLQSHDPTQLNRQGNDIGDQYRSAAFYSSQDEKEIIQAALKQYESQLGEKIMTEILPHDDFHPFYFDNSGIHQQYLAKPTSRKYCSTTPKGIQLADWKKWVPVNLQSKYAPKLSDDFWEKHGTASKCSLVSSVSPIKWP